MGLRVPIPWACSARVCDGPWGGARRRARPCGADQGARNCQLTVLCEGACTLAPAPWRFRDIPGQGSRGAIRKGLSGGLTLQWSSSPSSSQDVPTPASG